MKKRKAAKPAPKPRKKRPRGPDIVLTPRNRGNVARILEDHALHVDSVAAEFRRKSYHG